jgi:Na+-driven multidrug efflux pump
MNHIGQFALNATGDVNFTTVISIVSCWACSVGLAFVFVSIFHWGLPGIWIAFAIDEFFRGTLYLIRWKRGTWRKSYEKAAL